MPAPRPSPAMSLLIGGAQPVPQAGLARGVGLMRWRRPTASSRQRSGTPTPRGRPGRRPRAGAPMRRPLLRRRVPWRSLAPAPNASLPSVLPHRHRPYFHGGRGFDTAHALGHHIRVETQGSVGSGTPLTTEEIAAADLVIIAADREVDLALRRQARPCVQHQARHQRRPGPDRARLRAGQSASREQRRRPSRAARDRTNT